MGYLFSGALLAPDLLGLPEKGLLSPDRIWQAVSFDLTLWVVVLRGVELQIDAGGRNRRPLLT